MEKLYTVSKNKTWSRCGSDHQHLIAKFSLKLKQTEIYTTHKYPRSGSWMGKTDESLVNNKGNKERKLKCTK